VTRLTTRDASEHWLLLAVSVSSVSLAVLALREATPSGLGLRTMTAGALVLGLAAAFALWVGSMRRVVGDSPVEDPARSLLSAIPDGLLLLQEGGVRSVNRRLCELVGFDRDELLGTAAPLSFWPPEHRHEIEAWHTELEARGEHDAELTFRHRDGRRLRVLVAGRIVPDEGGASRHLVTVRDISAGHRRERRLRELAARDAETGLLNRGEFEERLGDAVRRAIATGTNVAVVLAELGIAGCTGDGVFRRPEALAAVERLRALLRAGDEIARTGEGELAWILPDTDTHGGVGAVARARTDLAALQGVSLTVGVCDLATAGDALGLYAFADRALATARKQGLGGTAQYSPPVGWPALSGSVPRQGAEQQ
jgi:PAS domain S-box-containing protein